MLVCKFHDQMLGLNSVENACKKVAAPEEMPVVIFLQPPLQSPMMLHLLRIKVDPYTVIWSQSVLAWLVFFKRMHQLSVLFWAQQSAYGHQVGPDWVHYICPCSRVACRLKHSCLWCLFQLLLIYTEEKRRWCVPRWSDIFTELLGNAHSYFLGKSHVLCA